MEIIAVVVGYLLGVIPFVLPKLIEFIQQHKISKEEVKEDKEQKEIIDEWLNGEKNEFQVTQEDIYNEYITGKVVKGD